MLSTMDEPVALSYAAKNADLAGATVSLKMKDGEADAVALRKIVLIERSGGQGHPKSQQRWYPPKISWKQQP